MREGLCPEAEDLWPEDRRCADALVEPEAPVGQLEALVGTAQRRDRHALDDEAAGVPDRVFALAGDLDDAPGMIAGRSIRPLHRSSTAAWNTAYASEYGWPSRSASAIAAADRRWAVSG